MGYKLKRILIYPDGVTEKQVYPARQKIIYDFKSQNVLTFKYQGDNTFPYGYTAGSGYYAQKSGYNQGLTLWSLPSAGYVNGLKKLTLTGTINTNIQVFSISTGAFNNGVVGIRPRCNSGGYMISYGDGSTTTNVSATTFPTGTVNFVVDVENLKLSLGSQEFSITSQVATAIVNAFRNGTLGIGIVSGNIYSSSTYTSRLTGCEIEYLP